MSAMAALLLPLRDENRDIIDKDKSVYLSYEEKTFVKKAFKILPLQSAGDLLFNVQDTIDAIDFKRSIQYHVRKSCVESVRLAYWMMWRLMTPFGAQVA